ncbi:adenosylcobinamide-GDP ribazoletransferase [Plastorhodobacter daqingensis]|uniref:Adenosylcobinamide-GDP ribazoletransferase n=1 Tax=Plastorhodobacter daqingensis TaxID=1387281 RepID=A0ABW2UJD2_9RHOB
MTSALAWLARIKIGGQTGDVLGASRQLTEVAALAAFAAALT